MTNLSFLEQGHSTARTPATTDRATRLQQAAQQVTASRAVVRRVTGEDQAEVLAALGLTRVAALVAAHDTAEPANTAPPPPGGRRRRVADPSEVLWIGAGKRARYYHRITPGVTTDCRRPMAGGHTLTAGQLAERGATPCPHCRDLPALPEVA